MVACDCIIDTGGGAALGKFLVGGLLAGGVTGQLVVVSSGKAGKVRRTERGDLVAVSACLRSCENPMSLLCVVDEAQQVESNEFRLGIGKLERVIFSDELGKRRDAAASIQRESAQERDSDVYMSLLCAEEDESWLSPTDGLLRIEDASSGSAIDVVS